MDLAGRRVEVIDLPGLYSLAPRSRDEIVVVDLLLGRRKEVAAVDAVVCIVDAGNLDAISIWSARCSNWDCPPCWPSTCSTWPRTRGIRVDLARLERQLGVPVVPIQANRRTRPAAAEGGAGDDDCPSGAGGRAEQRDAHHHALRCRRRSRRK